MRAHDTTSRMDLTGVVPVAVPLDPGSPMRITISSDTHIMYWCALHPISSTSSQPDRQATPGELLTFQRQLLSQIELTASVDGEPIPLIDDVRSEYGVEHWTVREPLSEGTHTLNISIRFEESPDDSSTIATPNLSTSGPPPTVTRPSNTRISWGDDAETTVQSRLIVTDESPTAATTERDPLWDRKEVYPPRDYERLEPAE
jgi:hypothetical protein